MKLLLLIENKDIINYLDGLITKNQDTRLLANDISQSLSLIKSYIPDWIVIDSVLKNNNSFEIAKKIKNEIHYAKICLLADNSDERLQGKAKSIGIECFISKEFLFELYEIIRGIEYQTDLEKRF